VPIRPNGTLVEKFSAGCELFVRRQQIRSERRNDFIPRGSTLSTFMSSLASGSWTRLPSRFIIHGSLEKEMAHMETWNTAKKCYELEDVGYGSLAYVLKQDPLSGEGWS
jgi:hypothetical protein